MEELPETKPLTQADKVLIFKLATKGFADRNRDAIVRGMLDEELRSALEFSLGIFGGSGGPGRPSISHKGSGLKIWGGWHVVIHVTEAPLFSGDQTIAMAREVHGITNPDDNQIQLF